MKHQALSITRTTYIVTIGFYTRSISFSEFTMKFSAIIPLLAWSASAAVITPDSDTATLVRRDSYTCNSSNFPSNPSDCNALYSDIESGTAYANLETANPRTLRYGTCFVSWSDNVVGNSRDLLPYINNLRNTCIFGQSKSGIVKDVHLYGQSKATAICLSSRGTGCRN